MAICFGVAARGGSSSRGLRVAPGEIVLADLDDLSPADQHAEAVLRVPGAIEAEPEDARGLPRDVEHAQHVESDQALQPVPVGQLGDQQVVGIIVLPPRLGRGSPVAPVALVVVEDRVDDPTTDRIPILQEIEESPLLARGGLAEAGADQIQLEFAVSEAPSGVVR